MNIKQLIEKISKDWPAKIICLSLAIFIYAFHQISILDSKSLTLPLNVVNNGSLMSKQKMLSSVKIIFKTDSQKISLINSKDIKAFVDLTSYTKEGFYDVPVEIKLSEEIKNIEPLEIKIKPERITVNLEEKVLKYIPVVPSVSGEVEEGYELAKTEVIPSTVKVVGPKSVVQRTEKIYSKKVIVKGAKKNFSAVTNVDNINSLLEVYPEGDFKVDFEINPIVEEKKYSDFIPKVENLSEKFRIVSEIPEISFVVKGLKINTEKIDSEENFVFLDCRSIEKAGEFEVPLVAKKSDLFTVQKITPEFVKISVSKNDKHNSENLENKDKVENTENAEIEDNSEKIENLENVDSEKQIQTEDSSKTDEKIQENVPDESLSAGN